MKNNSSKKGVNAAEVNAYGAKADAKACCGQHHGWKQIFIGAMFMIAGIMLQVGYGLAQVFIVVGGLLIIKGILVASMMCCRKK